MKKKSDHSERNLYCILSKQTIRVMKLTTLFTLMTIFQLYASDSYSQLTRISLKVENDKISDVLKKIEDKSEFYFLYSPKLINVEKRVNINVQDESIKNILSDIFDANVRFEVYNHQIILTKEEILGATTILQQKYTITGTVTDEKGGTIPGVSILVEGTTIGTTTDLNGKYGIDLPAQSGVLIFSFIGFTPQRIAVKGGTNVDVTMVSESTAIEGFVVVGYGTQKKVNMTGAVESIKGDKLAKQSITQASQALVGLAPGVTAIQSSGQPGQDGASINIRGIGSLGASNDPLVLIDGVQGDMNQINASDIESVSVLKDAASSSIYGSRASNGVILITTKRAKSGELSISYKNYFGFQQPTTLPKFLSTEEYLAYEPTIDKAAYIAGMTSNPDKYPSTDWVNQLFEQSGFQQYHDVSINAGTDKAKILASFSYTDQGANIKNYGYNRYTVRLNTDYKFNDKFNLNFDLSFGKTNATAPYESLEYIVREAFRIPNIYSAVHSDGSWGDGWAGENPVAFVNAGGYNNNNTNNFRALLKANYELFEGLKFTVMYAPTYDDVFSKMFAKTFQTIVDWDTKTTRDVHNPNSMTQGDARAFSNNFNALVSYTKTVGKHSFSALAGYEYIGFNSEYFMAGRQDFILQDYEVLNAGSQGTQTNSGSATQNALASEFGRINYSFKDRYLFEANIRRDASSRFAPDNRVGIFPSLSAGWRLSQEDFIKNLNVFDNLKLRASWGQLGNQQIGSDFPYASAITLGNANYIFGGAITPGASQQVLANPLISWETTVSSNIGLDVGLLKQRLTFSLDVYSRTTNDLLLSLPIPIVIGYSAPMQNAGSLNNKGWDFSAGWQDRVSDFGYGARFIISNVTNKVTDLAGIGPIIYGNSITEVGSPIGQIYGYETVGVFQNQADIDGAPTQFGTLVPGNLQYKDQNNDHVIDSKDRVALGNPIPALNYAFELNADYKNFDFSVAFVGTGKRDVLLGGDLVWPLYNAGKVQEWQQQESWSAANTSAKFPILLPTSFGSNDVQPSSTWVFNGSYLRVRNLTLGYTLPKNILSRIKINSVRVYFSGQNLITFSKMPKGIDPLVINGSEGAIYPITSSYNFGIAVKF